MIQANEPAFPIQGENPGMTLRQYYAGLSDGKIPEYLGRISTMEKLVGRKYPEDDNGLDIIKFEADAIAAIKVMRADALIKALNKKP